MPSSIFTEKYCSKEEGKEGRSGCADGNNIACVRCAKAESQAPDIGTLRRSLFSKNTLRREVRRGKVRMEGRRKAGGYRGNKQRQLFRHKKKD